MKRRVAVGVMVTAAVLFASVRGPVLSAAPSDELIRRFYADFNARNADALVSHVADDVKWMTVGDTSIVVEASGREALRASMIRYFRAMPTARARIEALMRAGDYVTVHERVTWTQGSTKRTQSAVAVYKLQNARIVAVWYFDVMP